MNIISLHPALTELLYALEAEHHVVAVTKFCDYPQGVSDKPLIGDQDLPDFDAMEEHDPELILLLDQPEIKEKCELRGWQTKLYAPQSLDYIYAMLRDVAEQVNKQHEVQALINKIKAKLVIIVDKAGPNTTKAALDYKPEPWLVELAKKAGIILHEDEPTLDNLRHFDPAHVVLVRNIPEIIDWDIPAIKQGKVTKIDPSLVRPSSRIHELAQKLGEIIRPEKFSTFGATVHGIDEWYDGTEPIDPRGQYAD